MPLDVQLIRNLRPANPLHYFPTIDSTMNEATRLAAAAAPHGTIVLADEQTAGIGRLGRSWLSQSELGIYCSILLRLPIPADSLPIGSLVLGLATAEAIEKCTAVACDLRWPNDVLVRERKVAGIITHLMDGCIVAGIGINVNQGVFPAGLRTPATSLRIESGNRPQPREPIIVGLLEAIDSFGVMLAAGGSDGILRAFTVASSYAIDRRVVIEENGARGVTAGLDENGFLLVRCDSGQLERVAAGGVRPDG